MAYVYHTSKNRRIAGKASVASCLTPTAILAVIPRHRYDCMSSNNSNIGSILSDGWDLSLLRTEGLFSACITCAPGAFPLRHLRRSNVYVSRLYLKPTVNPCNSLPVHSRQRGRLPRSQTTRDSREGFLRHRCTTGSSRYSPLARPL